MCEHRIWKPLAKYNATPNLAITCVVRYSDLEVTRYVQFLTKAQAYASYR
jgi:hypothetical protein